MCTGTAQWTDVQEGRGQNKKTARWLPPLWRPWCTPRSRCGRKAFGCHRETLCLAATLHQHAPVVIRCADGNAGASFLTLTRLRVHSCPRRAASCYRASHGTRDAPAQRVHACATAPPRPCPPPHAPRHCRCGGLLDALGDQRTACPTAGVLSPRGAPLERAAARVCREAGSRVANNVMLRDMNIEVPLADARRLEVLASGLPLYQ